MGEEGYRCEIQIECFKISPHLGEVSTVNVKVC